MQPLQPEPFEQLFSSNRSTYFALIGNSLHSYGDGVPSTRTSRRTPDRAFRGGWTIPSTLSPERQLRMAEKSAVAELTADRRVRDRRIRVERRQASDEAHTATERRTSDRRKVERRRQIDPTTCERDYQPEEVEFMRAMDDYKRRSGRQFPTWSEVLEVIRDLGYRKVAAPTRTYE